MRNKTDIQLSLLKWSYILTEFFNKVEFFIHCTQESIVLLKWNKILFSGHILSWIQYNLFKLMAVTSHLI